MELYLSYDVRSAFRKRVPLEVQTDQPHRSPLCVYRSAPFTCKYCGTMLYVSDAHLSRTGAYAKDIASYELPQVHYAASARDILF